MYVCGSGDVETTQMHKASYFNKIYFNKRVKIISFLPTFGTFSVLFDISSKC